MAYAFRAVGPGAGNVSGGALTVTKPTGTLDGDLIIVVGYLETASNTWASVGSGFVLARAAQAEGTEFTLSVWWKIASGEPASWTWTPTTSAWRTVVCASYTGATGTGTPRVDQTSTNTGVAQAANFQPAPSVTPTVTGDLLIYSYGNFSGAVVTSVTGAATNLRISTGGITISDNPAATTAATGSSSANGGVGSENFAAQHTTYFLNVAGAATAPKRLLLLGVGD
jgi:hypothetical protein